MEGFKKIFPNRFLENFLILSLKRLIANVLYILGAVRNVCRDKIKRIARIRF